MNVGAIGGQADGFGGGKPPIDQSVLAQLKALGLEPQGSKEADAAAIKSAQTSQKSGTNLMDLLNTIDSEAAKINGTNPDITLS